MKIEAIIFDMDGVLVDSERYWAQAEKEIFTELGVTLTDALTEQTRSMTTDEVIRFWYRHFPWENVSFEEVEDRVISRLIRLIESEDCVVPGVRSFIEDVRRRGYRVGLATNSPYRVIEPVLKKTGTWGLFEVLSSAEFEAKGKPHPDVYICTAGKLRTDPGRCLVIEDSHYGMLAARNAGMKVAAFTNGNRSLRFDTADYYIHDFRDTETRPASW